MIGLSPPICAPFCFPGSPSLFAALRITTNPALQLGKLLELLVVFSVGDGFFFLAEVVNVSSVPKLVWNGPHFAGPAHSAHYWRVGCCGDKQWLGEVTVMKALTGWAILEEIPSVVSSISISCIHPPRINHFYSES